jgi:hypothetical protein
VSRYFLFLLVFLPALAPAGTLEPDPPALGERALLRLETAPADSTQWPVGLNAAIRATVDPAEFEFVPLRVGTVGAVLPATGDTLFFEVPTTIDEVRPEFLRPLASIGDIAPDWRLTILLAVLVLGLVAAAIWVYFARRRSQAPVVLPPPEPAEIVAMRELARLEDEHLVEAGRFEEFYVRGSHILRDYAGRRFGLPVLDFTTSETLDSMRDDERASGFVSGIAPLLIAADEVKFARHHPERADGEHWLRSARDFVEITTPEPEPEEATSGDDAPGDGKVAEVSA